jgi:hypothetical protein
LETREPKENTNTDDQEQEQEQEQGAISTIRVDEWVRWTGALFCSELGLCLSGGIGPRSIGVVIG